MEALAVLEEAKPRLKKSQLEALRRYTTLGLFMERLLQGNFLDGSITATALQRTSAKDLLEKLSKANDRLVVMHDSTPAMLLVNLKKLADELERARDLQIALDRNDGPWITDHREQDARLKELGFLP